MAARRDAENVIVELPPEQLTHFARVINHAGPVLAKAIAVTSGSHLTRLGVRRDLSKAMKDSFAGAINSDTGTLFAWMAKIQPKHRRAIAQLVALDASACARGGVTA